MSLFYRRYRVAAALALVAIAVTAWPIGGSAQAPQTTLPLDPMRDRGNSITPAFEGWFPNPDGSFSLMLGYYNRNTKETLDIPVGPNNHVDPGGPDQGQPTHFEIGRQWGVFVVKVPKDFGTKTITWTIVANGETQAIPFTLNKGYPISPYKELGMGNQPPVLAFSQGGAKVTGPPTSVAVDPDRNREPAGPDQRLGGRPQADRPRARRRPAAARCRWRRCRSTSSADLER